MRQTSRQIVGEEKMRRRTIPCCAPTSVPCILASRRAVVVAERAGHELTRRLVIGRGFAARGIGGLVVSSSGSVLRARDIRSTRQRFL